METNRQRESQFYWNGYSIFIDCGIHAREWISPAVCRLFIHELMKCTEMHHFNQCDPVLRDEFYNYNWFIIPILNPDGYQLGWPRIFESLISKDITCCLCLRLWLFQQITRNCRVPLSSTQIPSVQHNITPFQHQNPHFNTPLSSTPKTPLFLGWRFFGVELRDFRGWKRGFLLCWTEGDPNWTIFLSLPYQQIFPYQSF